MPEMPSRVPQDAPPDTAALRAGFALIAGACATWGALLGGMAWVVGRVLGWWGGCF